MNNNNKLKTNLIQLNMNNKKIFNSDIIPDNYGKIPSIDEIHKLDDEDIKE